MWSISIWSRSSMRAPGVCGQGGRTPHSRHSTVQGSAQYRGVLIQLYNSSKQIVSQEKNDIRKNYSDENNSTNLLG